MGSATITENLGAGKYKVRLDTGQAEIATKVTEKTEALEKAELALLEKEMIYEAQKTTVMYTGHDLRYALEAWVDPASQEQRQAVQDQTDNLAKEQQTLVFAERDYQIAKLTVVSATKELEVWEKLQTEAANNLMTVWCVDNYPDMAVGATVGTVEINGEVTKTPEGDAASSEVKIVPGGPGTAGKGTLERTAVMNEKEYYISQTLKRGWQKNLPTYRTAVITAIDYDTDICSVALDEAFVKDTAGPNTNDVGESGFNINQAATLENVPIKYMECNATPFAVDSHVVVEFEDQKQATPAVVGFVQEPKACGVQVKISFKSASTVSAFLNYCDSRIANLSAFRTVLEESKTLAADWIDWENDSDGKGAGAIFRGSGLRGQ